MDIANKGERIKASTINALSGGIDAQARKPGPLQSGAASPLKGFTSGVVCSAENVGDVALQPYDCAVIRGQSHTAGTNAEGKGVCIQVAQADADHSTVNMVICLTPIPVGQTGYVCVAGVAWANTNSGSGAYASPVAGSSAVNVGTSGIAAVLSGSGTAMALLRFPVGGGAATIGTAPWAHWGGWT